MKNYLKKKLHGTTVFVGCGFAAKYLYGGGNFSVPLQWVRGLVRLGVDVIWLELMPSTSHSESDHLHIQTFIDRLRIEGLENRFCLLFQKPAQDSHNLEQMECFGLSKKDLKQRLSRPSILLNLSHSIHPPFILEFERRIYCDLDPAEISYWMSKIEMGQSYHHEFWTIGFNIGKSDCKSPKTPVCWKTFYPLVDTELYQAAPRPLQPRFTTIGQWYWLQGIEMGGQYPDFSKKATFEKYMKLPQQVPEAVMELAMNLNSDDPEIQRMENNGWHLVQPHIIADSPQNYRKYIKGSLAEFTTCKGIEVLWQTGWLSDRAAAYLATGRPVITENTGAKPYLPAESGFLWVSNIQEAIDAVNRTIRDWERLSHQARKSAVEFFDSTRTLGKILG